MVGFIACYIVIEKKPANMASFLKKSTKKCDFR